MIATLPLHKLKYAVTVAHDRHSRKAADRLHVTQPSMSRQIREFEQELGFEIFCRDRHFVALTDAGRAFILAAEEIIARLEAGFKRARDIGRLISRRNAASFLIGYSAFVPPALRHEIRSIQRLRFPSIHLQFRMAIRSEMIDSVSSGLFQPALTFAPLERNDLQQIQLRSEPLHVLSSWRAFVESKSRDQAHRPEISSRLVKMRKLANSPDEGSLHSRTRRDRKSLPPPIYRIQRVILIESLSLAKKLKECVKKIGLDAA